MGQTADEIRDDIENRRQQMTQDVQELEDRAKSMMDWRQQFDDRPLMALGVAAAGGMLLGMLTGGLSDDKSQPRSQPVPYPYQAASHSMSHDAGHDGQQSRVVDWVSGERGPKQATDAGKQRAATKVDEIRGALMGLAATKAEEFLKEALPGFSQEVERVQQQDPSSADTTNERERSTASGVASTYSTD